MIDRRRLLAPIIAGALALAFPVRAPAQAPTTAWPSRTVRLVVPFAPAGGVDVVGRILAARLSQMWDQQIVVENRGGAGGNIAAELVARSPPDGYTLFIVSLGHAINQYLFPALSYDPIGDFAPVTLICVYPNVMVVPMSSPAHSVQEFIAYAKANRGKVTFASSSSGTSVHLAGELFKRMAGIEMAHVPYRGAGPAYNDLIPGRVDVMFATASSALPQIRSNMLRGLAVTTLKRLPIAAELPTLDESGLPGFDVSSWFAFFVPAATPPGIIARINADTLAALREPAIAGKIEQLGAAIVGSTPAELGAHLKTEMAKWGPIIRDAQIKVVE
jgi:tripartite-type tricarboxylate transporter receptor subunit TctC